MRVYDFADRIRCNIHTIKPTDVKMGRVKMA